VEQGSARQPSDRRGDGVVVVYCSRLGTRWPDEVKALIDAVAKSVADIKHYDFQGNYENTRPYLGHIYFVPDDTLMLDEALSLGIRGPDDFFGGVVPHPFVKTKAITHQLVADDAARPEGWSSGFAQRVLQVVLPGYTAFDARDAYTAATRLLTSFGTIRVKDARAAGGEGQTVLTTTGELEAFVDRLSKINITSYGLVLEANLSPVATFNIGQIRVGSDVITYFGTQRVTTDNRGRLSIGGSDLTCVHGSWEALHDLPMTDDIRVALAHARQYDIATCEYPGFTASRRNYDVGIGIDGRGHKRAGVFESSWRFGGASTAELAALALFIRDETVKAVDVSVVKKFGLGLTAPVGAVIHFLGDDPQLGPMIRYTVVTRTRR